MLHILEKGIEILGWDDGVEVLPHAGLEEFQLVRRVHKWDLAPQGVLEIAPRLLYGIQVAVVGRQMQGNAARVLDDLVHLKQTNQEV